MVEPILVDIDEIEAEAEMAPEPGMDMIIIPFPVPTYKALSDAAAKKGMTVAQLFARAIAIAIQED